MIKAIDAHIHLDKYDDPEEIYRNTEKRATKIPKAPQLVEELAEGSVEALIAVSMNQSSCIAVRRLQQQFPQRVFAASGYHPEQKLPTQSEL